MQVAIGTPVSTRDDQAVGTVDQLILDPATSAVKAAVIRRGGLVHRDVEVPVTALEPGPAGSLRLVYTADQLDQVPDFQESRYTATPPIGTVLPAGYGTGGLLWPVGAGIMPPVAPVPGTAWEADAEDEAGTTPTQPKHRLTQRMSEAASTAGGRCGAGVRPATSDSCRRLLPYARAF